MKSLGVFILTGLFLIGVLGFILAENNYSQITDQECDAENPCEDETLECYSFPNTGLRCAEKNPCKYYQCPEDASCFTTTIYPGGVSCDCDLDGYRYNSEENKCEEIEYDVDENEVVSKEIEECQEDSDCVLGIRIDTCCDCPQVYTQEEIDGDDNLVIYEKGKDYSDLITSDENCSEVVCSPCVEVEAECEDNICVAKESEEECEWECSSWSECINGIKTRICTNPNNCTTETPKESKTCNIKEEIKEAIKERNRLRFEERTGQECPDDCTCTGVVMKCTTEEGREMTVYAGRSGNIIVQVKGTNMTTNVTLYKDGKGTLYGIFKGQEKKLNILPDQVKEKIREKIKTEIHDEEIELDENAIYKVKAKKRARFLWIIPVKETIRAEVNSETGEIVKIKKGPWWGFLARDIKETEE